MFYRIDAQLGVVPPVITGEVAAAGRLVLAVAFRHLRGRVSATAAEHGGCPGRPGPRYNGSHPPKDVTMPARERGRPGAVSSRGRRAAGRMLAGARERPLVNPQVPGPDPLRLEPRLRLPQRPKRIGTRLLVRAVPSRDATVQIAKTAFAAALAWEIAIRGVPGEQPVLAPLAAVLAIEVTVQQTLRGSAQRVAAVVVGVAAADVLVALTGLHAWSIGLVIAAALAIGRLLRLGELGNEVAVSALLVMTVVGSTHGLIRDRVVDTVVGGAVGAVVNLLIAPPTRVGDAGRAVTGFGSRVVDLLAMLGTGLAEGEPAQTSERTLREARVLERESRRTFDALDRAAQSLRLNLRGRGRRRVLRRYEVAMDTLSRIWIGVRLLTRTVAAATADGDRPADQRVPDAHLLREIGVLLSDVAEALEEYVQPLRRPQTVGTPSPPRVDALDRAHEHLLRLLGRVEVSSVEPRDVRRLYGPTLSAVESMLADLAPREGATPAGSLAGSLVGEPGRP